MGAEAEDERRNDNEGRGSIRHDDTISGVGLNRRGEHEFILSLANTRDVNTKLISQQKQCKAKVLSAMSPAAAVREAVHLKD